MLPEPIGKRISKYRELRALTQEQLAARLQAMGLATIARQRVTEMEAGNRVVKPEELVALARALDLPISTLLGVPDYAKK